MYLVFLQCLSIRSILGCFFISTFLKLNTFGSICDGILTLIPTVNFFAIMTSFRGGTAVSKSAGDRNLEICHNSATEGNRETKLVSKYAEGSVSYTRVRDFMAVF